MSQCLTTSRMAERFELGKEVCEPLQQVFARWDGKGVPDTLAGDAIAMPMRLFHLTDTVEVHHRTSGTQAAIEAARVKRGTQFDPAVAAVPCAGLVHDIGLHGIPASILDKRQLHRLASETGGRDRLSSSTGCAVGAGRDTTAGSQRVTRRTSNRARATFVAVLFVLAGAVATAGPAQAASFSNNYDGQDSYTYSGSTTLNYSNGHAAFNERIWTDAGTNFGSRPNWPYTIRMYNVSGSQVWSATNQTRRTYWIGSNVTRIVITPNSGYVGVAVNWRRA